MASSKIKWSTADPSVLAPRDPTRTVRFRAFTLFAESPDTVRAARDMARSALQDWGVEALLDDVRLVVSELVGNVVHHAVPDQRLAGPGAPRRIDVTLRMWPKWLFVGVADEDSSGPTFPMGEGFPPCLADGLPEAVLPDSGRGILIINRLADAVWWVPGEDGGKTVYCRFDLSTQR